MTTHQKDTAEESRALKHFNFFCAEPGRRFDPRMRAEHFYAEWSFGERDPLVIANKYRVSLGLAPHPAGYSHGHFVPAPKEKKPVVPIANLPRHALIAMGRMSQELPTWVRLLAIQSVLAERPDMTRGLEIARLAHARVPPQYMPGGGKHEYAQALENGTAPAEEDDE